MHTVEITTFIIVVAAMVTATFVVYRRLRPANDDPRSSRQQLDGIMCSACGGLGTLDVAGLFLVVAACHAFGVGAIWFLGASGLFAAGFLAAYGARHLRRSRAHNTTEFMGVRFGHELDGRLAASLTLIVDLALCASLAALACVSLGYVGARLLDTDAISVSAVVLVLATVLVLITNRLIIDLGTAVSSVVFHVCCLFIALAALASVSALDLALRLPPSWTSVWPSSIDLLARTPVELEPVALAAVLLLALGLGLNFGGTFEPFQRHVLFSAEGVRAAVLGSLGWSVLSALRWAAYLGMAALVVYRREDVDSMEAFQAFLAMINQPVAAGLLLAAIAAALLATLCGALHVAGTRFADDIDAKLRHDKHQHHQRRLWIAGCIAAACIAGFVLVAGLVPELLVRWLTLVLLGGLVVPHALRWFWWRYNAWAYVWGVGYALLAPTFVLLADTSWPLYALAVFVFFGSVPFNYVPAFLTAPPTLARLKHFYRLVEPAGAWRTVREEVRKDEKDFAKKVRTRHDFMNALMFVAFLACLYVAAGMVIVHALGKGMVMLGVALLIGCALYRNWKITVPGR